MFSWKKLIDKDKVLCSFIEIADCCNKVRLHVDDEYNYKEYISKIDILINELSNYKDFLIINTKELGNKRTYGTLEP